MPKNRLLLLQATLILTSFCDRFVEFQNHRKITLENPNALPIPLDQIAYSRAELSLFSLFHVFANFVFQTSVVIRQIA